VALLDKANIVFKDTLGAADPRLFALEFERIAV
jgi:hypothetical protein